MNSRSNAPLNGAKTHPLSDHALDKLASLEKKPCPRQDLNAGVVDRFEREELVEEFDAPSPYKSKGGKNILWLRITTAGISALREAGR